MQNVPVIKIGIVAVSRDCFPESLAVNRRKAVIAEYEKKFGKEGIYECPICIVESEIHAQQPSMKRSLARKASTSAPSASLRARSTPSRLWQMSRRLAVTPSAFTSATSVLRSLKP